MLRRPQRPASPIRNGDTDAPWVIRQAVIELESQLVYPFPDLPPEDLRDPAQVGCEVYVVELGFYVQIQLTQINVGAIGIIRRNGIHSGENRDDLTTPLCHQMPIRLLRS